MFTWHLTAFPTVCRRSPERKYQDAFGVLTALILRSDVPVEGHHVVRWNCTQVMGGSGILFKVGTHLPDYTASNPRRQFLKFVLMQVPLLPFFIRLTV